MGEVRGDRNLCSSGAKASDTTCPQGRRATAVQLGRSLERAIELGCRVLEVTGRFAWVFKVSLPPSRAPAAHRDGRNPWDGKDEVIARAPKETKDPVTKRLID